jgi:hypothetical protein
MEASPPLSPQQRSPFHTPPYADSSVPFGAGPPHQSHPHTPEMANPPPARERSGYLPALAWDDQTLAGPGNWKPHERDRAASASLPWDEQGLSHAPSRGLDAGRGRGPERERHAPAWEEQGLGFPRNGERDRGGDRGPWAWDAVGSGVPSGNAGWRSPRESIVSLLPSGTEILFALGLGNRCVTESVVA